MGNQLDFFVWKDICWSIMIIRMLESNHWWGHFFCFTFSSTWWLSRSCWGPSGGSRGPGILWNENRSFAPKQLSGCGMKLPEAKADMNQKRSDGCTPAHAAAEGVLAMLNQTSRVIGSCNLWWYDIHLYNFYIIYGADLIIYVAGTNSYLFKERKKAD